MNINQLNPAGLAQLAGASAPRLDLPLFGNTATPNAALFDAVKNRAILQQNYDEMGQKNDISLFEQQQMNNRNQATLQNQLQTTQMAGQNQMALERYRQQMDEKKLAAQQNQFDQTLGLQQQQLGVDAQYKQGQLDAENERTQIAKLQEELKARSEMKKEKREEMSAAAGAYLMERQKIENPADQEAFDQKYMNMLVSNGIYSKTQADRFLQNPVELRPAIANQDFLLTQKANDLAVVLGKKGTAQGGMTITQNPDGTTTVETNPTKAIDTKLQTDVLTNQKQISSLNNLEKKVEELQKDPNTKDIFTRKGNLIYDVSVAGEYNKSLPIVGGVIQGAANLITGKSPEQQKQFIEKVDEVNTIVTQLFNVYRQQITGAAAAQQELDRLQAAYLNKDMSPSQYIARMKTIRDMGLRELGMDKKALREGIDVTEPKMIRVIQNSTGRVGQVPESEYNDNDYKRL